MRISKTVQQKVFCQDRVNSSIERILWNKFYELLVDFLLFCCTFFVFFVEVNASGKSSSLLKSEVDSNGLHLVLKLEANLEWNVTRNKEE